MSEAKKFSIVQETPFAWQSKEVTRFIRKNFSRTVGRNMIDVYRAITEMASDASSDRGVWDRQEIANYALMSRELVIEAMKGLKELKFVLENQRRDAKRHNLTPEIVLNFHNKNPESEIVTQGFQESASPTISCGQTNQTAQGKNPESDSLTRGFPMARSKDLDQDQEKIVLQKTAADAAPHQQIIDSHHVAFQGKYNIKPDYKPQDFAAVKSFLARGQTVNSFLRILPNFMAAPGKFTAGHSLKRACDNWQAYLESERGRVERPVGKVPASAGAEHSLAGPFARH